MEVSSTLNHMISDLLATVIHHLKAGEEREREARLSGRRQVTISATAAHSITPIQALPVSAMTTSTPLQSTTSHGQSLGLGSQKVSGYSCQSGGTGQWSTSGSSASVNCLAGNVGSGGSVSNTSGGGCGVGDANLIAAASSIPAGPINSLRLKSPTTQSLTKFLKRHFIHRSMDEQC
ncbi:unnamed protein product [Protopolystoma xenopodis]|uniref:Uncharacterized protein n=1 Tax=Protopolystoma xenopodis TaxID=117903 RepID=A0A3S5BC67_9PLAT|nr:unnamed protein product [Protopolystoma xenopodis]